MALVEINVTRYSNVPLDPTTFSIDPPYMLLQWYKYHAETATSIQVVLECYRTIVTNQLIMEWAKRGQRLELYKLLSTSSFDYRWVYNVRESDSSAGPLKVPSAVTSHKSRKWTGN